VREISRKPDRISSFQKHLLPFRSEAEISFDVDNEFFGTRAMGQGVIDRAWWYDQLVDFCAVIAPLDE
jgi:hypothetical protein